MAEEAYKWAGWDLVEIERAAAVAHARNNAKRIVTAMFSAARHLTEVAQDIKGQLEEDAHGIPEIGEIGEVQVKMVSIKMECPAVAAYGSEVRAAGILKELVARMNAAHDTVPEPEPSTTCAFCGADVGPGEPPVPNSEDEWAEEAKRHGVRCEWILTRAHTLQIRCDISATLLQPATGDVIASHTLYAGTPYAMEPNTSTEGKTIRIRVSGYLYEVARSSAM